MEKLFDLLVSQSIQSMRVKNKQHLIKKEIDSVTDLRLPWKINYKAIKLLEELLCPFETTPTSGTL